MKYVTKHNDSILAPEITNKFLYCTCVLSVLKIFCRFRHTKLLFITLFLGNMWILLVWQRPVLSKIIYHDQKTITT